MTIIVKFDDPISLEKMHPLQSQGFVQREHFTKIGMLYMESKELILSGQLGSNKLQIKCKVSDCKNHISNIEDLLSKI